MRFLTAILALLMVYVPSANGVIVSRLELDHPAQGTAGGAALHSLIEDIYIKIGDSINSRFFTGNVAGSGGTIDFDHNFKVDFSELRAVLYSYNTGSGESTRMVSGGSPDLDNFTITATPGNLTTQIRVTNNSGSAEDISLLLTHGKGAELLDDLNDVDVTTVAPVVGETIVWNGSNFVPGASGDASFQIESVTDPNATIKGGSYAITSRRKLSTYDGAGTASTDFGGDLACDLDAILGANPTDDTTYNLYVDLNVVGNTPITTTDTGDEIYPVECSDMVLLTAFPEGTLGQRYVPVGFIHSADSGTVWSGTGAGLGTHPTRLHDQTYVTVSPVIYSLAEQAVGTVGGVSQIVAGHQLTDDSFLGPFADNSAYWNLQADALDDGNETSCSSGTADCDLTNNGSVAFSDTDMFGVVGAATFDGTAKYLSSSDDFFDPGNADFSVGMWVSLDDWNATQTFLSNVFSGADRGYNFSNFATTGLKLQMTNTAGSYDLDLNFAHGLSNGDWAHVAFTYESGTPGTARIYLNGVEVASGSVQQRNVTGTTTFQISGQQGGVADHLSGSVREAFFWQKLLSAEEIRKLASYRIDHNKNVALADQNWVATFNGNLANQLENGWIVDKSTNSIWFDFFDLASTDNVGIKLKNENASAHVLPLNTFDTGFLSSAPSFPLSHGLGSVPAQVAVIHEGQTTAGDYDYVQDKCSWDDTQITCTGLNTVDGTHRLRIVLSTSTVAVAVAEATATDSGIVTTQAQTFAGDKTFNDRVGVGASPEANIYSYGGDGTYTGTYDVSSMIALENNQHAFAHFNAGSSFLSGLIFSNSNGEFDGRVQYDNTNRRIEFYTAGDPGGSPSAQINSAGEIEASVDTGGDCGIGNICQGEISDVGAPINIDASCTTSPGAGVGRKAHWYRVGNMVTVIQNASDYGGCNTTVIMGSWPLPIASNLAAIGDLVGSGACNQGLTNIEKIAVFADTTNNRANLRYQGTANQPASGRNCTFTYTYIVK